MKCPELNVKFSENTLSGVLLAGDFIGVAKTRSAFQSLIDIYVITGIVNVGILKPM